MATLAELQDALVNADRAGDAAAAKQLADAIVAMQQTQEAKPAAVKAGEALTGLPRQLGLTARYAIEGPAQLAQVVTEPIRQLVTDRLLGQKSAPLGEAASRFADRLGLPTPEGANERVVGDAARLVAGGGAAGAAGRVAQAVPGAVGEIGKFFASNLPQQLTSAAGAGLAGGAVREAGGGPWQQAGAAMLGGVTAPMAANAVISGGRAVGNTAKNLAEYVVPGSRNPQAVDQQIALTLRQQGVDWGQVSEAVKQQMRKDVADALNTGGQLDPAALRRLLDFRTVGATPTRGMLTQDPVQITREQNLARTGANSLDVGLQRLPQLQNQNTATLLNTLDNAGARNAPDAFATGERVIGSLQSRLDAARNNINSLYSSARDTTGRSAPLDGAAFTTQANKALDDALLGGALPESVAGHLNRIARGEVPFTVDYAEQLKTAIGNLQRASNDGQTRMALGLVRKALDNTPLRPAPQVNPGNLPAVPGTVPPSPAALGEESINAFNQARAANRALMQRAETTPALQAVMDGTQPDRFVQQFITGQGQAASFDAVRSLRREIGGDQQALEAVRQNIVSHLRSAATNGTEDVTKFSPAAYNKALNAIGERKLGLFFEPQELARLQAVGRVGTLMNAQPAGAAVNNSNSGALMIGKTLDALGAISGKLPLGLDTTINGVLRGVQQGQALNVPKSLLAPKEQVPLEMLLAPPAIYGGLLASQPLPQR